MNNSQLNTLVGIPFRSGGRDPASALDCWGLVAHVLASRGRVIEEDWHPDSVSDVAALIRREIDSPFWVKAPRQPWLVAAMGNRRRIYHVGVTLPCGKIMHTTPTSGVVVQTDLAIRSRYSRLEYYRSIQWDA